MAGGDPCCILASVLNHGECVINILIDGCARYNANYSTHNMLFSLQVFIIDEQLNEVR